MATMIAAAGSVYYTQLTIQEARTAVDANEPIPVWWFASWGQRYAETAWFPPDKVDLIRTEHDDG